MFVRPSVHLSDASMHAYVECASVHSSVHPFVCIHECFILACVYELSVGVGIILCLSVLFDLLFAYPIK